MADSDYLIVGKSTQETMELLVPGLVKTGQVEKGKTKYYFGTIKNVSWLYQ